MAKKVNPMITVPFTYSELYSKTIKVTTSMYDDLEEFAAYRVTIEDVQYLDNLVDELINMQTDKTMRNLISTETEAKAKKREVISETMRSIALRAKVVLGAASAKSRSLNAGNISKIRDAELELIARRIYNDALAELEALSTVGLTKEDLDKFDADIDEFSLSAEKVKTAIINRELIAEKRQAIGAEIYSLLCKYCGFGKMIFAKKSRVRYKHYVLNKSKKKQEAEPEEEIGTEN